MRKRVLTLVATSFLSFKSFDAASRDTELISETENFSNELKRRMAEDNILSFYNSVNFGKAAKPDFATFRKAMIGFLNIQEQQKGEIGSQLTIIDFNLPSTKKRMWVVDMQAKKLLFHELVAHGRNSGNNYATKFSNQMNSNASSLGFFLTAETYIGKFGRALRLDGLEKGINDRARQRGVVFHGANYVNPNIAKSGRLGRSFGCPAVNWKNKDAIIDKIVDRNVMYINGPDFRYEAKSLLLNTEQAFEALADQKFEVVAPTPAT